MLKTKQKEVAIFFSFLSFPFGFLEVPVLSKIFWIPAECSALFCRCKMGTEIQGKKVAQTEKALRLQKLTVR